MANCKICNRELNTGSILRKDCGGDCLECMAIMGDPDCEEELEKYLFPIRAGLSFTLVGLLNNTNGYVKAEVENNKGDIRVITKDYIFILRIENVKSTINPS